MIPIPLDQIINAIKAIATPVIKNKLERNNHVIKLLKQFNLDPDHPPADFSGVYAYALVQYGVGQPKGDVCRRSPKNRKSWSYQHS